MKKFFNGIRWTIVAILIIPTFLIIVGGGFISGVSQSLTNPENPKVWLQEGGVYESAIKFGTTEIINRAKESKDNQSLESITDGLLNEEQAEQLAQNIFPPQWVKVQTESIIDSFYSFLENDSSEFSFQIDISEVNENAKEELSSLFINRARDLPECSSEDQLSMSGFDILEADCIPSFVSESQIESQIENEIDQIPLLQDNQVTSEDLGIQIQEGGDIKRIFKFLKGSPLVILLISLILTFLILILTPNLKKKLKTIGYLWGLGGFTIIVISLIAKTSFSSMILNIIVNQIPQENILTLIKPTVEIAYSNILSQILVLGSSILAIGAIVVLASLLVKEK